MCQPNIPLDGRNCQIVSILQSETRTAKFLVLSQIPKADMPSPFNSSTVRLGFLGRDGGAPHPANRPRQALPRS
jgi:hypothetical protein